VLLAVTIEGARRTAIRWRSLDFLDLLGVTES
jgi:hypothetical protein